ncbi:Alpha/Beta hydrolase protein [Mycena floridula]|nr:Alpha/Beta hydrolase protein [Mycena floridula]
MDKLAKLEETELPGVVLPTIGIFLPLLEEKRSEILAVPKRTFKYGATDRHKLDIYYPSEAGEKTKILFFIYGGGFTTGDRNLTGAELGYGNLGAFFAGKGMITVIPDYRLVPNVVFPEPARDVRDAIEWIVTHPENLVFGQVTDPDVENITLMGHSAGATHIFTMLALSDLYSSLAQPKITKAILSSGAYHFQPAGFQTGMDAVVVQYYGNAVEAVEKDPMGLLDSMTVETRLPQLLLLEAEKDPAWLKAVGKDFLRGLLDHPKIRTKRLIMKGHNHISPNWALGTGQGEEWAEEVLAWIGK